MKQIIPLLFFLCAGLVHAAEVSAELSADSVSAGQGVMLKLNVTGGRPTAEPDIPEVKDLIINPRGTSQNIQIVNGSMTRSISFSYVVGSNTKGEYTVPAIKVMVNGKEYFTKPLSLKVRGAADAKPKGMNEDAAEVKANDYGRLTMQMVEKDREHVYPGEIAPVRVRAYFPANARVSLKAAPRPEGSAFTLHNLSEEPKQTTEVIDGKRYLVVTWFGGLSATKAGRYPASIKLDGTMAVRDSSKRRRRPSVFDDPFFDHAMDDFFAPMVEKDFELSTDSEGSEIEVIELPQEGRPDNFTGAIGRFEFESVRMPSSLHTGEPCRIEAVLKGEGNFSLLTAPQPTPASEWKSYSGKSEFEGDDVASFGGRKAFHFSSVPLAPSEKDVELTFSYFDPDKGEYVEVKSQPQKVSITGEVVETPSLEPAEAMQQESPSVPQLAPLALVSGGVESYAPLSDRDWFLPVLASCGLISLGALGWGWWKSRAVDPAKIAREELDKATHVALTNARKAVSEGNANAFFNAAREAVSLRIAGERGINPEAVTAADLEGMNDEVLTRIFSEADRMDYSGRSGVTEDLEGWNDKLDTAMKSLTFKGKGKRL